MKYLGQGQLEAGVASVNITPPLGLEISGYGFGKSRGILDDLYAKVLFLENGEDKVVIITTDLIGFNYGYVDHVREGIYNETGVSKDHVLICGSHTHSGPGTMFLRRWGEIDEDYVRCLEKKLIDATVRASQDLATAKIGFGKGHVDSISYNRVWEDGPIDPEVGVVRIDDGKGRMKAILMNFSCHPVNLHSYGNLISADFPGYARRLIERTKEDVCVLYTNGAGGDINPAGNINNIAFAERNGIILGCEALKTAEQMQTASQVSLWAETQDVRIPLGELPDKEFLVRTRQENTIKLQKLIRDRSPNTDDISFSIDVQNARLDIEWTEEALSEIEKGQPKKHVSIEIQVIRINNLVLLAIPGEVYVEIGTAIKKSSRLPYTFIVGYANGCIGYIPTRRAYEIDFYETAIRKVYGIYPFASDVEKIVKDCALKMINRSIDLVE